MPNQFNSTNITRYQLLIDTLESVTSDECMIWPYAVDGHGYGQLTRGNTRVLVHRIAFHFAYGHWPVPVGRHTCDTPRCFNPLHIVEGTMKQNSEDMVDRRRNRFGERHYQAKLTSEQVVAIRTAASHSYFNGTKKLAIQYGVSEGAIYHVLKLNTWKQKT